MIFDPKNHSLRMIRFPHTQQPAHVVEVYDNNTEGRLRGIVQLDENTRSSYIVYYLDLLEDTWYTEYYDKLATGLDWLVLQIQVSLFAEGGTSQY